MSSRIVEYSHWIIAISSRQIKLEGIINQRVATTPQQHSRTYIGRHYCQVQLSPPLTTTSTQIVSVHMAHQVAEVQGMQASNWAKQTPRHPNKLFHATSLRCVGYVLVHTFILWTRCLKMSLANAYSSTSREIVFWTKGLRSCMVAILLPSLRSSKLVGP